MKTHVILRREAGHGGIIPRGWQMAWYEPHRRVGIYYPSPLHWVLRALREFAYRLRIALCAPRIEHAQVFEMQRAYRDRRRLADEYARGYLAGWREGYQACVDVMEEEIARADEVWEIGALLTGGPKPSQEN